MRFFEQAAPLDGGAGEGAAGVPEELGVDQLVGECGAVDARRTAPRRALTAWIGPGHQFLADAALAFDQHRERRGGHLRNGGAQLRPSPRSRRPGRRVDSAVGGGGQAPSTRQERPEQIGGQSPSTHRSSVDGGVAAGHQASAPIASAPKRIGTMHAVAGDARSGRLVGGGDQCPRRARPHGDRRGAHGLAQAAAQATRRRGARGVAVWSRRGRRASRGPRPPRRDAGARRAGAAPPAAQKVRIQFTRDAAVSHRRRVAWPRSRGHRRWPARRSSPRSRPAHPRPPPAPGRLRPRPAHGHRIRYARSCSRGVRRGRTTGAPVALLIENRDWVNWQRTMHTAAEAPAGRHRRQSRAGRPAPARPRRPRRRAQVRARRRARRARAGQRARDRGARGRRRAGAAAARGGRRDRSPATSWPSARSRSTAAAPVSFDEAAALPADAPLRCVDPDVEARMIARIDEARAAGDTLGGSFEVIARGLPPGLGSYVQWDRKLDGRLAQAVMSIPAIKGVGIGLGATSAARPGSQVHDEILPADRRPSPAAADQPRRGSRGRRHQRRGRARRRAHEADCHADAAAAVDRSHHARGRPGRDRAQRRLCGTGRRRGRRGDGRAGARRRAARALRRRCARR